MSQDLPLILSIDPGTERSAWIVTRGLQVLHRSIDDNLRVLDRVLPHFATSTSMHAVCEMIASYGMPVGKDVFQTVLWIGRFMERWRQAGPAGTPEMHLLTRGQVKLYLCHSSKANDATIRQAILDLYPRTGGGKTPQIGTRAKPGPLYGIVKDLWSALAVALTFAATLGIPPTPGPEDPT